MGDRSLGAKRSLTLMYGVRVRRCTSPYFGACLECAGSTV